MVQPGRTSPLQGGGCGFKMTADLFVVVNFPPGPFYIFTFINYSLIESNSKAELLNEGYKQIHLKSFGNAESFGE